MKIKALAAIVAPVVAVGLPFAWPNLINVRSAWLDITPAAMKKAPAPLTAPVVSLPDEAMPEFTELQTGVEQGIIKAEFRGNGRDWVRARLVQGGKLPMKVQADVGQMFEAGLNAVVIVRPAVIELPPGKPTDVVFETAAIRSANKTHEQPYRLTYGRVAKLNDFLGHAAARPDLSLAAIQTAVLALNENLPLSAVCKFPLIGGELKSRFNTDAFRVETPDLIAALAAIRDSGVRDDALVMTVDPQLKLEAMIDPLCRAAAMRYYGLTADQEWNFWRTELLQGEPATRHYALYGIARFYPEVALEMHPKWARETRTTPVFRLAAVQALAETQKAEAIPLLRQLADELGLATELGRAAAGAAEYLEDRLASTAARQSAVAFRASAKQAREF